MKGTAIAIGTFDGVHRGHQLILAETRGLAAANGLESVAYTFESPPRLFRESGGPSLLLPPGVKRRLLASWVDRVVAASFPAVRDLEPDAFVDRVLIGELACRLVVVGSSFRFGRERRGDSAGLAAYGTERGVHVHVTPPLEIAGAPVSSTRIRAHLQAGEIERAAELLGRPPMLLGTVQPGDRIGRTLGFPTANLSVDTHVMLPAAGIYFAHALGAVVPSHALVYIGTRPTLSGVEPRCEVHLLTAPDRELYGLSLEIHLLRRIREDRRFPSLDALRAQMQNDLAHARGLEASFPIPIPPAAG
ncbi:MAG: riboflavin biosynthesis protein RibF [Candidatus Bipolaricaulota bacterium]|nr:riboflavin biosynthesis protein RibF [Candidatus Bipolaricaulota bacterium]